MNLAELRWLRLQCIDQDPRIDMDQVRQLVEQAIDLIEHVNDTEEVEASEMAEDLDGVKASFDHNVSGWKECLEGWDDLEKERDEAKADLAKLRNDLYDFATNVVGRP